jgi:hypothetical protein
MSNCLRIFADGTSRVPELRSAKSRSLLNVHQWVDDMSETSGWQTKPETVIDKSPAHRVMTPLLPCRTEIRLAQVSDQIRRTSRIEL